MIDIIPAIDIVDGKCVRLTQGDFDRKTIYSGSPLEIAKQFEGIGVKRLHIVDLDGARFGKISNLLCLNEIASNTDLQIDFGGGIRDGKDIENIFNAGATMISVGSIAVKQPDLFKSWLELYGAEKILLGTDVNNNKIVINGWKEQTEIDLFDFIRGNVSSGLQNLFCTDIKKDGMMEGSANDLYEQISDLFQDIYLIASGGVSNMSDLVLLENAGCKGVIVGKAIYEERVSLKDLQKYILNNGTN